MSGYKLFQKEISGPFTIPSGLVATEIPVLAKIAKEIPEIGILTTKSIGLEPRKGNSEPIIAEYAPFSFINAVGLTNPGAVAFAEKLSKIKIPEDKFLLISIFGDSEEEFKKVAEILYDFSDGFELNLSCPHSKQYGQTVGQNKELVEKIIKNVVSLGKPVFIKISPNLEIEETVRIAVRSGVAGFTAINTKGPELFLHDNNPILTNEVGGVSGKAIFELGLKCVREIRKISNLPIIGCGGISTVKDIIDYKKAGANFFGIGSALAGMKTEEIKEYFKELAKDLENSTNNAVKFLKDQLNTAYKKYKVKENKKLADDLFLLEFDQKIEAEPGQFIFAWLPQKGEKPFSILDDEPLSLLIQKKGCFTNELSNLKTGDVLYIRGPYGNSPEINGKILLVGGGCGLAALHLFAKKHKNTAALLGTKDKNHLAYLEQFKSLCQSVYAVTENGEIGDKGLITDFLETALKNFKPEYCLNCGPEQMIEAVVQKESVYLSPDKIYSSIDFLTKCGIGLCGSCATPKGYRSCVDGTFFTQD